MCVNDSCFDIISRNKIKKKLINSYPSSKKPSLQTANLFKLGILFMGHRQTVLSLFAYRMFY